MSEPTEITTSAGQVVPLKLSIHYISFSAHSDFQQTSGFLDILMPPHVVSIQKYSGIKSYNCLKILVHGDANEMGRLKSALVSRYEGKKIEILTPKNCQTVYLKFCGEKKAKVLHAFNLSCTDTLTGCGTTCNTRSERRSSSNWASCAKRLQPPNYVRIRFERVYPSYNFRHLTETERSFSSAVLCAQVFSGTNVRFH